MKKQFILLVIVFLLTTFYISAQEKWSVELRPGLSFPTSDMANINSRIGYGIEFITAYKIMPHLAIYGGWGWNEFKGKHNASEENLVFQESGFTFGLQIIRNIGTSPFSYFLSGGAIYNHIILENNAVGISADSGYGFGWQTALGVDYEFAYNFSLRPTFRYRSLSRNVEFENVSTDLKLKSISFGIGLIREF